MKYNIIHFFDNTKFKYKIILITTIVSIIISSFSIIGYEYSLHKYSLLLYEQTAYSLSFFTDELSNTLESISDLSNLIAVNPSIQNDLTIYQETGTATERIKSRQSITQSINRYFNSNMISISIVPEQGPIISWGIDSSSESHTSIQTIKSIAQAEKGGESWVVSDKGDGSILCVRQIRKTSPIGFLNNLGYLTIRIDLNKLIEDISSPRYAQTDHYTIAISDNNDDSSIIYPIQNLTIATTLAQITSGNNEAYYIEKISHQPMFITNINLKSPNWNITFGIPYDDIFFSIKLTKTLYFIALIFTVGFALLFSSLIAQSITRHFHTLITKMNRLKAGNFEIMETSEKPGNDELGLLNQYFDEMTIEFKKMIDDNYVKQLLITQAQLKSLEQQINPHFLYNTLESINWFAKRSGEKHIPRIVEALANLLRNNLSEKDDAISLEKELSTVKSYLYIQQIRFSDTLHIEFDIDENVLEFLVPKMSIQPLVENAIIHSMEELIDDKCLIQIHIKNQGDFILVSIENTGSEIDEHILEKLRNHSVKPHGNGVGLMNIDSRIKIIFGNEYGLQFENTEETAIVKFIVPKKLIHTTKENFTC